LPTWQDVRKYNLWIWQRRYNRDRSWWWGNWTRIWLHSLRVVFDPSIENSLPRNDVILLVSQHLLDIY
jgi:hypothetical protein